MRREFLVNYVINGNELEEELNKKFKLLNKKVSINPSIFPVGKNVGLLSGILNSVSVKSFAYLYRNSTGSLNAIVQGGRTYNEQWWDYLKHFTMDIDMSGCYATDLKKCSTLKQFLKENGDELVDNFWTIKWKVIF